VGVERSANASLSGDATDTAILSGTLGYVAPEVLRGEPVSDALADQFSYAVTMFLALTGQKPFAAGSLSEYLDAVTRGQRAEWPRSIPRRIREVVERGLASRADERYPDVRALVEALEKARRPSRRPLALGAAGLAALLLTTAGLVVRSQTQRELCRIDTSVFAGVWDRERRATLEQALTSTGRFNASEAFGLLSRRLDKFERDWLAMRQDACLATHVRGEQSERVLGLRSSCLDRKLEGVKELVTAFSTADPRSVDRAAGASPESIRDCANTAELLGVAEQLPDDPALLEAIGNVESGFAVTRALIAAGRNSAIDNARTLLESARQIGHEPTIARAVASLGYAISVSSRTAEEHELGEQTLRESVRLAAKVGDKHVLAQTASHLFVVLSYGQRRVQEADAMLPMVEAFVSGGGNDVEHRLRVLMGRGVILSQRRRFEEATKVFDEVIALAPSADSELRGYAAYAHAEIGKMAIELGHYPEAVQRFQAALDGIRAELGNRHPRVIFCLVELGLAQSKAGFVDAAWGSVERIRELVSSMYPPGDWRYLTVPFVSGSIWHDRGQCERALPLYREAFATVERTYGATHSNTADVEAKLGSCLHALGQDTEAVTHLERVLEIRNGVGSAPNVIAEAAFQLADVLAGLGARERERAIALAERALSSWREDGVMERARAAEEWLARR
jgi:tetratricopeptide (TPR) repeat protein